MKMKRICLIVAILLSFTNAANSQFRLEYKSFEEVTNDLSARTNPKFDFNGDPTALLRIQIPLLQDAVISSPQKIGKEEYDPGEFRVYLCDGTRKVTIRHRDFEPFEYIFDQPVKGKTVYKLVLKVPEDYISLGAVSVRFNTNVLDATLQIDKKEYHTDNGEIYLKLKKGIYPYTISTSMNGYTPTAGNFEIIDTDVKDAGRIDRYIELQSDKRSNLHLSAINNSKIKVDGNEIKDIKKAVSLTLGRHYMDVELAGYRKTFAINLLNDNEYLDADIRVPFTIISPSVAEYSIIPLENALKPTLNKFKSGQTIRLLGKYKVTAKARGYETKEFEIDITPEMTTDGINMAIPLTSRAHNLYVGSGDVKQNIEKAIKEYKKQISNGDELAMWEYGNILINTGDISNGQATVRRAADLNHPKAALYSAIKIVNKPAEKRKYLDIALKGGESQAHEVLGDLFLNMNDYEKAFEEYSQFNTPHTMIKRAQIALAKPEDINIEPADIVDMLECIDTNDSNYAIAQNMLGEMAYQGYGLTKSTDKAVGYWSNVSPAILSQEALLIMAVRNRDNNKLNKYAERIDLSTYDKDSVIVDGVSLVQFLTNAARPLQKSDVNTSFRFLQKSFDLGDRSLITVVNLGKYYKDGTGVIKNEAIAKEILQIAVDRYQDAQAMRWLGNIYEHEKDLDTAEKYYKKAIALNDSIAKGYYATFIFNKSKTNYALAEKLWTEAAEAGHKQSIKNLIKYYEKVSHNPAKVNYWKNKL